jgi:polyphosphate glucokinase
MKKRSGRYTLAIDVGGSHIKTALLGKSGDLVSAVQKTDTPKRLTPGTLLKEIVRGAKQVEHYDRVAVGIPGVVSNNIVYSLPVSGRRSFKGMRLASELESRLGAPVRVTNDATMHGLAVIEGKGVEMVITLGTGLGTALFIDRVLSAHYQTLPKGDEASPYGDEALESIGQRKWQKRICGLIDQLRAITNYDHLYVGGGNAKRIKGRLPSYVTVIDNAAGVIGGHRLWEWGDVP